MVLFVGLFVLMKYFGGASFFSKKKTPEENFENATEELLCRFVVDSVGKKIGESVTIEDDILIIKKGGRFLGVPLKHVEEKEKMVVVKGLIDFSKAYELGENWRKESFRDINEKEGTK